MTSLVCEDTTDLLMADWCHPYSVKYIRSLVWNMWASEIKTSHKPQNWLHHLCLCSEAKRTKRQNPFLGERTFPELVFVSNNIWHYSDITQSNIRSFWCFIHVSLKKVFYRTRWNTRGQNNKQDYLFMYIFLSPSVDNVGGSFLFWIRGVVPICQQQQSIKSSISKSLCSPSLITLQSFPQAWLSKWKYANQYKDCWATCRNAKTVTSLKLKVFLHQPEKFLFLHLYFYTLIRNLW